MNKLNQILIAILVLQVGLAVYAFWPQTRVQAGGPLLPGFAAADVVGLIIQDNDNRLVLSKSGADWVLTEADDFPADGEKITPVLEKLEGIQTNRLVTQTEASHTRLKVAPADFNRLIEIELKNGSRHQLYLGSSAGAGATHVRLDDQPEVYLTGEVASFDANTQASAWIDTIYYTVPQTATVALTLQNANGTFEFEKVGESWTMKGLAADETFNESALTSLLNQVSSVQMTAPVGREEQPSFGLDVPQAIVSLKTRTGNQEDTYTFRVGARSENGSGFIAGSSESPYYVQVAEFTGTNLIDKTRDDFLAQPPAEEPGIEENNLDLSQPE